MNRYEILLAGFTFVGLILYDRLGHCQYSSQYQYKHSCDIDYSVDGLETINCSSLFPDNVYNEKDIPAGLGKKPQVFYFVPIADDKYQNCDLLRIPFQSYPELKKIIVRRNGLMFEQPHDIIIGNVKNHAHDYRTVDREAFIAIYEKLAKLEYLELSQSYYVEPVHFILPKNLKTYNISGNDYSTLYIKGSTELDDLNANYNKKLQNVPQFHLPIPPVTKLRLKGCPLTDMTIFSIAPLCNLELLELEFEQGNRFVTQPGYCNCTILKQWANENQIKIESVKCYEPKQGEKIDCPTEQYLNDAKKDRKKCPLLKKNAAVAKAVFTIMKYIFFSILFLLLLAALILYVIRHYHLREWWREHHLHILSKAQPTPTMEESLAEEETPPVDGNAEWV